MHPQQRGQQVEGGDSALLVCSGETPHPPPGSPVSSSGALSTGKTQSCWSGARGGHKNGQRDGTPLLGGKAERVGAVQPGEEEAAGRPYSSLLVPEGRLQERCRGTFYKGM